MAAFTILGEFDPQDALMLHQETQLREEQGGMEVERLMHEYVDVCELYADDNMARDTHSEFVGQVETMRSLLSNQRVAKSSGADPTAPPKVSIVRSEWGREFFRRLRDQWNEMASDLAATVIELSAMWALGRPDDSERWQASIEHSSTARYYPEAGLVLQKYPTIKHAKQVVHSFHAMINAPLSQIHVPFAAAMEVFGIAFVGFTLCPIKSVMAELPPYFDHMVEAVGASLRFLKTAKNAPPEAAPPEMAFALGADCRIYAVNVLAFPQRADAIGMKHMSRYPRRETLFGPMGVCTSPSSPNDFILKYKMRAVLEHLLQLSSPSAASAAAANNNGAPESFTAALHTHGLNIGTFVAHIFNTLLEQEKVFQQNNDAAKQQQSNVARQQYMSRKKKFDVCKGIIISELIARTLKRCIRERWRRICAQPAFVQHINELMTGEREITHDQLGQMNRKFIDDANKVLNSVFVREVGGGRPLIHQQLFTELLFILNDTFVKRRYESSTVSFRCTREDIDGTRIAAALTEQLGVSVTFEDFELAMESHVNCFDTFFSLDVPNGGVFRTPPTVTSIEVPVCFAAGSKGKLVDFAALQQRIAMKVAHESRSTNEQLIMAKFIFLLSSDVTIAHRGFAQSADFDDVLNAAAGATAQLARSSPFFDLDVLFRRALLMGPVDAPAAVKNLARFAERCKPMGLTPRESAVLLAMRISALCRLCDTSPSAVLISMLEAAIGELNTLTGYVPPAQRRRAVANPDKTTLRINHCSHLYLPPLTILVRVVLQPDASRPRSEALSLAINYCSQRRDVIVSIYGEESVEAGIACNDIASICSNNKYDLEKAEEEFEKAVMILRKVQPEGPAVFVTQNNLAFLYFRKAERLRQDSRGLTGDRLLEARNRQQELLDAAEVLLDEVLNAEESVPALDLAAACNNLASIMLFRSNHKRARELFERTLSTTSQYASAGNEPACRLHAQKNLKILARRLYMNAILRIQLLVRRFVTKLRNRRAVIHTRCSLTLQRFGRAFIERHDCAMRYRFSGYHFWMRQPRAFTRQLESTLRDQPVHKRWMLWEEKLELATLRLQRVFIAHHVRKDLGTSLNFQRAYHLKHRATFISDVDTVFTRAFAKGVLEVKTVYGCEQQVLNYETQQRCVRYTAALLHKDMTDLEFLRRTELWQELEYSGRRAVLLEREREMQEHEHRLALTALDDNEYQARRDVFKEYFMLTHELLFKHLLVEENYSFEHNVQGAHSVHFVMLLEFRMRNTIQRERDVFLRGLRVAVHAPSVGRGYLTRRALGKMRKLFRVERFQRELIEGEERELMSFGQLQKQWDFVFHEHNEASARGAIEALAVRFWDMDAPLAACAQMREMKWRLQAYEREDAAWLQLELRDAQDRHIVAERVARRNALAHFAESSRAAFVELEANLFDGIVHQAATEFRVALLASVDFATRYISSIEARARNVIVQHEALVGFEVHAEVEEYALMAQADEERRHIYELMPIEAAAITQRDFLRRLETTARRAIVAYEQRGVDLIATGMARDARRRIECAADYAMHTTAVKEVQAAVWMGKQFTANRLFALHTTTALVRQEAVQRNSVVEACAVAERGALVPLMARSLDFIREEFVQRSPEWTIRGAIDFACDEEALGLLVYRSAVLALMDVMRAVGALKHTERNERMLLEEAAQREVMESSERNDVVAATEDLLEALHGSAQRECVRQHGAVLAALCVEHEAVARLAVLRQGLHAFEHAHVAFAEVAARESILFQCEMSLVEHFLLAMHGKFVARLFVAQRSVISSNPAVLRCREDMQRLRRRDAVALLQRVGRGVIHRRRAAAEVASRNAAVRCLQRVGRAGEVRRRLVFREAEEVEHCMLYAAEMGARSAIVQEQERAAGRLALYGSLNPAKFRRRTTSNAHASPSRRPAPPNQRVYATPQWSTPSLFATVLASRNPVV